jgi:hypothetical protein
MGNQHTSESVSPPRRKYADGDAFKGEEQAELDERYELQSVKRGGYSGVILLQRITDH